MFAAPGSRPETPPAAAPGGGEFTMLFKTQGGGAPATPEQTPTPDLFGAPSAPPAQSPPADDLFAKQPPANLSGGGVGEFTRLFGAGDLPPARPSGAAAAPPPMSAHGATGVFSSPTAAPQPPAQASSQQGEYTRLFAAVPGPGAPGATPGPGTAPPAQQFQVPQFQTPQMPGMPQAQMPQMPGVPQMQTPQMQMPQGPQMQMGGMPQMQAPQMPQMQMGQMQAPQMQMGAMPQMQAPLMPQVPQAAAPAMPAKTSYGPLIALLATIVVLALIAVLVYFLVKKG